MKELSLSMNELFDLMLDAYQKGLKRSPGGVLPEVTTLAGSTTPLSGSIHTENTEDIPVEVLASYRMSRPKGYRKGRPKGSKNKPKTSVIKKGKKNGN